LITNFEFYHNYPTPTLLHSDPSSVTKFFVKNIQALDPSRTLAFDNGRDGFMRYKSLSTGGGLSGEKSPINLPINNLLFDWEVNN
jgi:hypothetical protein